MGGQKTFSYIPTLCLSTLVESTPKSYPFKSGPQNHSLMNYLPDNFT